MSIGDKLTPIAESFTLKDHTFAVLRAAILDMDIYSPNTDLRLDERKLANKLGISRTPIREALARLAQEDLVQIIPRKGVFVCRKTRQEILEMIITWAAGAAPSSASDPSNQQSQPTGASASPDELCQPPGTTSDPEANSSSSCQFQ